MKNKKHISRPSKSPLAHNDMYHVSVSEKEINLGDTYNEKKVEHAEFSRWSGDQICWFIIGIVLSSVSAIVHNWDELTNKLSWDEIDHMLALFPRFAEDAGLSIILALLAIVAGLSVGIAVEDLSKSHMFRFRYMSKMLMRLSGLSACFLGLSSASLLLRYGKGLGTLLILVLLYCFTMFYGIGDISVNYRSQLRELLNKLTNIERELNDITSSRTGGCFVFNNVKWWSYTFGGIGSLIDIFVCVCISIYHPEQLVFNVIMTLMVIVFYYVMIYCLGRILYESITLFKEPFKGKSIVMLLYSILLIAFSCVASFYFSMLFILVPNGYVVFDAIFKLLSIILSGVCIFLFIFGRRFLFVETRITQLKKQINVTRHLIVFLKSEHS